MTQRANSVGRSPAEPHGAPLSTRTAHGSPHRANAARSCPWVKAAGTPFHRPRGENRGEQHRAGELVGDPQPRDLAPVGQGHLLGGVDLPDLVGAAARPSEVSGRRPGGAGASPTRRNQCWRVRVAGSGRTPWSSR